MSRQITQRQVVHGLFLIQIITSALIGGGALLSPAANVWGAMVILTFLAGLAGLWAAYWRGWEQARQINAALVLAAVALGTPAELLTSLSLEIISIPVIVLVLAGPWWMLGGALVLFSANVLRVEGPSPYLEGPTLVSLVSTLVALTLYALIARGAREAAEASARQAEANARAATASARQAEQHAQALNEQLAEQQRLLQLVESLEVPVLSVGDALVVPLVGALDERRLARIQQSLLEQLARQRSRVAIIDLTGVSALRPEIVRGVEQMAQAVRLLGAEVTLSGIRAEVALAMTSEARGLAEISSVRDLGEGLIALAQRG